MNELYNTIIATYRRSFSELTPKTQFHFAGRLYLWQREPFAADWLGRLRPGFTANNQPLVAVRQLLAEPPPVLQQTGALRAPYFDRYPQLRPYERALFRLAFMHTLYGLETRALFDELFDSVDTGRLREALLDDAEGLAQLSSFGINFLYLLVRFARQDDAGLPLERLLHIGQTAYGEGVLERRLQCYFYTHCIIGESLFYGRPIPQRHLVLYRQVLAAAEDLIGGSIEQLKLDNLYEFLVCCRLLGHTSRLETQILLVSKAALSPEGYLVEPASTQPPTLNNAEHRNVLFLMAQRPYQPLFTR